MVHNLIDTHDKNVKKIAINIINLIIIPIILVLCIFVFTDTTYYLTEVLMLILCFAGALIYFDDKETRSPQLSSILVLSVLCAVCGLLLVSIKQIDLMISIVIISGVCLGSESGFIVGIVSVFIENIFLAQSALAPFHMLCFGLIGFFAGTIFNGKIKISLPNIAILGATLVLVVNCGIINTISLLLFYPNADIETIFSYYASNLSQDLIHSVSVAIFLLLISKPMIKKFNATPNALT